MRRTRNLLTHNRWIFELLFISMVATAACSFSVKAIDRPVAEFINANVKPEWLLNARLLSVVSTLIPFVFLIVLVFHYVIAGETREVRNRITALVVSVSVAILCVEIFKATFCRASVGEYLAVGAYGFRYPGFSSNPDLSSFPSEYSAIMGTIAASLYKMIPSYRPTVILIVVILFEGQLITGSGFVSDVLSGLAIGISTYLGFRQLFSYIESHCENRAPTR